jgi:acetyl esterase/lipase
MGRIGLVAGGLALACCASHAQTPQTFNVWPGVAPGSERWTQQETTVADTPVGPVVFNVVTPTMTVFLPKQTSVGGASVIIAPGGGFVALAIDREGTSVARWLQDKGIAAFLLKYRTVEKRGEGIPAMDQDVAARYGIADGIQAVKVVRQRAVEWGLAPGKVGFIGFSAGAMVASGTVLQLDVDARPNFAGFIYGGPFGVMPSIPAKLPPLFLAWAQDDAVALNFVVRFHDALKSAGHKPEVHIFNAGGHGFGMHQQGTSSDHWIEAFYNWLQAQKLT